MFFASSAASKSIITSFVYMNSIRRSNHGDDQGLRVDLQEEIIVLQNEQQKKKIDKTSEVLFR